jgi:hypothetical protein
MALATHAGRLERWLGREKVEALSESMRDWYGPPILVAGVPGRVYAHGGGDFRGTIKTGAFAHVFDAAEALFNRIARNARRIAKGETVYTGFASFSDLLAEAAAGKRNTLAFQKAGTTGVVAVTNTLWFVGNQPAAGAAAAAAPGGTAWTKASTGAMPFANPSGTDTQHLLAANVVASVAGNQLLLYDRLFSVTKAMNSTTAEAVTGTPTRYQSTTQGAEDSAEGNFLCIETRTALAATAHNWTVCTYTAQGGTTGRTLPSVTGNSGAIVNRLDQPASQWFCPLDSGDSGIKALTQMQCSAAVASGAIDFTIGHPLAWIPCPLANYLTQLDFVNSPLSLVRIFNDACLALLEVAKSATTATTYTGTIDTVMG